jgi:hypothetical protein
VFAFCQRLNRRIFAEVGCHRSSKPSFRELRSAKSHSGSRIYETHSRRTLLHFVRNSMDSEGSVHRGTRGAKLRKSWNECGYNCLWVNGLERIYETKLRAANHSRSGSENPISGTRKVLERALYSSCARAPPSGPTWTSLVLLPFRTWAS